MPHDVYGLRLTASDAAAAAYVDAQQALRHVRVGARAALRRALAEDPGFTLAGAALGLEDLADGRRAEAEAWASQALRVPVRGTEREASQVFAVAHHIRGRSTPLIRHLREFPGDCVALHHAVPSVGSPGLNTYAQHAWVVAERAVGAYGDDWWYASVLAYVRQEQQRWDEAYALADRSLAQDPAAGQAAHARAHVAYETGGHTEGLRWLDGWLTGDGSHVATRSHFAWHAALHELALGRYDAMRQRYREELAPPAVTGERAMIDSCSLLWRWSLRPGTDAPTDDTLRSVIDEALLRRPTTAFGAMHAVVACCVLDDEAALDDLTSWAEQHADPTYPGVVAPLAHGLALLRHGHASRAADLLRDVRRRSTRLGGSAPQRDVIDDSLIAALLAARRFDEAAPLIDARTDRRGFCDPAPA